MDHLPAMFLGATFILIGVLGGALADRIRGSRTTRREAFPQSQRDMAKPSRAPKARVEIGMAPSSFNPERRTAIPVVHAADTNSDDVVALLVSSGFTKSIAMKAVAACGAQERATQERWVIAALHRASGVAS